jgi:RHS repeat-associated protein
MSPPVSPSHQYPQPDPCYGIYNPRGELDALRLGTNPDAGTALATFSYNLAGQRTGRQSGNGIQTTYGQDGAGRLNYLNAAGVLRQDFGHDLRDRRIWTLRDQNLGDTYTYFADSQLNVYRHSVSRPDQNFNNPAAWTDTFNYDGAGNRTSWNENGTTTSYTADALNQYSAISGNSGGAIAHDARGNVITWGGQTLGYDADNRLTSVSQSGLSLTFAYDPEGRLVKLVKNGSAEYRYYDGAQCYLRTDGGGSTLDWTVWGPTPDEVIARNVSGAWQYYHQDQINSVYAVTNSGGSVLERYLYDAFGAPDVRDANWNTRTSTAIDNPWLFTGQEWRADIQLANYKARWYQPTLGRFLQTDPVRFDAGDINLYRYCKNNPIDFVDPNGHALLAGFLVGAGIDFATQMIVNKGDFSKVDLKQTMVSGLVGATGAGLGGVIANSVKSVGLAGARAVATEVVANGIVSGATSAGGKALDNALHGKPLSEGVSQAATSGAILGAGGRAATEATTVALKAGASATAQKAFENADSATKLMAVSNATDVAKVAAASVKRQIDAAAAAAGLVTSNLPAGSPKPAPDPKR